ncbi:BgtAc-30970 [Blumeria graminis f. sp. tritici]|uniref:BgtAc-30970 n=3 Tax=Blumeria graminis TaxID=34373 RepID=A0A9X9MFT4_BLUGR|nr:hypothetical protein BGT96224_Ac30970 [Blumeria graminis f. sp. tritici 96224]VDB85756.1 BgtAc-30970 [Blumeria graminis f. sp. tritici]
MRSSPHPFYGVYQPPAAGIFPTPVIPPNIIQSHGSVRWYGTHTARYCSTEISPDMILEAVISDLEPMPNNLQNSFHSNFGPENSCLKHIRSQHQNPHYKLPIYMSKLLQEKKCTEDSIASLAFLNHISVVGKFKGFVPPALGDKISVTADQLVPMEKLVLKGLVYRPIERPNTNQVLAWYYGHLHLFEMDYRTRLWYPLTNLRFDGTNGGVIANYLEQNLAPLRKSKQELTLVLCDTFQLIECIVQKKETTSSPVQPTAQDRPGHLYMTIEKLSSTPVEGQIGAEQRQKTIFG